MASSPGGPGGPGDPVGSGGPVAPGAPGEPGSRHRIFCSQDNLCPPEDERGRPRGRATNWSKRGLSAEGRGRLDGTPRGNAARSGSADTRGRVAVTQPRGVGSSVAMPQLRQPLAHALSGVFSNGCLTDGMVASIVNGLQQTMQAAKQRQATELGYIHGTFLGDAARTCFYIGDEVVDRDAAAASAALLRLCEGDQQQAAILSSVLNQAGTGDVQVHLAMKGLTPVGTTDRDRYGITRTLPGLYVVECTAEMGLTALRTMDSHRHGKVWPLPQGSRCVFTIHLSVDCSGAEPEVRVRRNLSRVQITGAPAKQVTKILKSAASQ